MSRHDRPVIGPAGGQIDGPVEVGEAISEYEPVTLGQLSRAWIAFPYATDWQDYSGAGTWVLGQYRKSGDWVELRGLVERATGTTTTIGTLPEGYRPTADLVFTVMANDTNEGDRASRVDVDSAGVVIWQGPANSPEGYVSLTGICFSVK